MDENKEIIEEVTETTGDTELAHEEEISTVELQNDLAVEVSSDDEDISHVDTETPLDKNVKLMSPTRMVMRRFFRSRLSIVGLCMVIGLFVFSFLGPLVFTNWGEIEVDERGKVAYASSTYTYIDDEGNKVSVKQTTETNLKDNTLAAPSLKDSKGDGRAHLLGTDKQGYDVFVRLMYGGRISLTVSFLAVFVITMLGVVLGGLAGYFGGSIDNFIMRICDILMCLPGVPILLIISLILDSAGVDGKYKIYLLMIYLTLFSWPGTARLVRGQILSLREQEYMVAAEAMGYSVPRKIFKHLIPNVMPQLIVQMSLSLGGMILYESTLSYLNLGVKAPYAAWGTMINIISTDMDILQNYFNVWGPPGICIVIAVLGFNFVGDGLRDALDPKMRR